MTLLLILAHPAQAEEVFYQTSFITLKKSSGLSWKDLNFENEILYDAVDALTGDGFPSRPEEWFDYFDHAQFEDEDPKCLKDPSAWYLVAIRTVPLNPELRLTFQPFCQNSLSKHSSDTAIQLILKSDKRGWSKEVFKLVKRTPIQRTAKVEDLGFVLAADFESIHDLPAVLDVAEANHFLSHLKELKAAGFQVVALQWMASTSGQLDWIFGRLERTGKDGSLQPVSIPVTDSAGIEIVNLGFFDFLPLILRRPFQKLSAVKKELLKPFHVTEDPHESLASAKRVLSTDLRVSNPELTNHQQTTCIQCHGAQERMERTLSFLKNGGAKEFGYFFRGLGLIEDRPYVSWRSVQESRDFDRKIKSYFNSNPVESPNKVASDRKLDNRPALELFSK